MKSNSLVTEILREPNLFKAADTLKSLSAEGKGTLTLNTLRLYGVNRDEALNIVLSLRDFFRAPASTKHHGNFEGGLFIHSYLMFLALKKWSGENLLRFGIPRSPLIVGLFHDLCKEDAYKPIFTEGEPTRYDYNENQLPLGSHALASLVYAQDIMKLTEEEILCIRWHMGSYETDQWKNYEKAIKAYETVLWTHHADMYVSKVLGV